MCASVANEQLACALERMYACARERAVPCDAVTRDGGAVAVARDADKDDVIALCTAVSPTALQCFCAALRVCPLPMCSASAAAILPGASIEVLQLFAHCLQQTRQATNATAVAATTVSSLCAHNTVQLQQQQQQQHGVSVCSPFRFASTRAFHRQLRAACAHSTTMTTALTRVDALVHGVCAAATRARSPSPPPPRAAALTQRKRPRSVAAAAAAAAAANTSAVYMGGDVGNDSAGAHTVAAAPLQRRIDENDSLLDELLTTTTASTTTTTATTTAVADAAAQTATMPLSTATLKELRVLCVQRGLPLSGTKAELQRRLVQQQQQQQQTQHASPSSTSTVDAVCGVCVFTARDTNDSGGGDVASHVARCAVAVCTRAQATTTQREGDTHELRNTTATTTAMQQQQQQNSMRRVAAPHVFVQAYMQRQQEQQQQQRRSGDDSRVAARRRQGQHGHNVDEDNVVCATASWPASSAASAPPATATTTVVPPWQLLVDARERVAGQHARMLDTLRALHVPCATATLPAGDFLINVQLDTAAAATTDSTKRAATATTTTMTTTTTATAAEGGQATTSPPPPTSSSPLLSHVLALVVERKTESDLDASVKGRRYGEQRQLLSSSPFACVVWLVEASRVTPMQRGRGAYASAAQTHSALSRGASRAQRAHGEAAAQSACESVARRVLAACTSLAMSSRFVVVRTRSVVESCQFLRALAQCCVSDVALATSVAVACGSGTADVRAPFVQLRWWCRPSCNTSGDNNDRDESEHTTDAQGNGGGCCGCCCCWVAPTNACSAHVSSLQKQLRAQTVFPRMLMCVRGCAPQLAALLVRKYGSMYALWQTLRRCGREVCDAEPDIQALPLRQQRVFVLLTEFMLAKHYA